MHFLCETAEAYLEPSRTSMMKFNEVVNGFHKRSIEVGLGSK